jgi:hypothetical protein
MSLLEDITKEILYFEIDKGIEPGSFLTPREVFFPSFLIPREAFFSSFRLLLEAPLLLISTFLLSLSTFFANL